MVSEPRYFTVPGVFLDRHIDQGRGGRISIWTAAEAVTYREIHDMSWAMARSLYDARVRAGDRVAFIISDSPYYVAAIFGVMRLGAIAVPLSTRLALSDYVEICEKCEPRLIVLDDDHFDLKSQPFASSAGTQFLDESDLRTFAHPATVSRSVMLALSNQSRVSDPAIIQFTSGSTGRPKGVVHSHQNIIPICDTFLSRLNLQINERCYSVAKLSFGYGFGNSLLFPFYVGASCALDARPASPTNILDTAKRSRATILFATPAIYAALLHSNSEALIDGLRSVRLCVSGGEHLENSLFERWKLVTGIDLINGIGSTECLHIFIASIPGQSRTNSTGKLVSKCDARIVSDTGSDVSIGQVGELWIKSSCNMQYYWNDPQGTSERLREGWVQTADLFSQDEDGYFYYHGRANDTIKVRAQMVRPFEVEAQLRHHSTVKDCCVVGSKTKDDVAVLLAYVQLKDGEDQSLMAADALKRYLAEHLAQHKIPSRIIFVDKLPLTPTGKLDRGLLARVAAQ